MRSAAGWVGRVRGLEVKQVTGVAAHYRVRHTPSGVVPAAGEATVGGDSHD
jgi:hypothetical protein